MSLKTPNGESRIPTRSAPIAATVRRATSSGKRARFSGEPSHWSSRVFEPGDFLVRQGDIGHEVFLIREGSCDVIVDRPDGSKAKVATRGKGDFIGEMAVSVSGRDATPGKARTASVVAVSRVTATCLTASDMQWAVDHDYSLESQIDDIVARRKKELESSR